MKKVVAASSHILRCLYIMRHTAEGSEEPFVAFYGNPTVLLNLRGARTPRSNLTPYNMYTPLQIGCQIFFFSGPVSILPQRGVAKSTFYRS
jgi:hypothetical protein